MPLINRKKVPCDDKSMIIYNVRGIGQFEFFLHSALP